MSSGQELFRLQQADSRIAALSAEIAAAEALLRRDPALERARDAAAAAQVARQERERDAGAAEAEVNALQGRVKALDRRLYGGSVHNPQDLLDMQRELESLRARLSDAEDGALLALSVAEAATADEQRRLEELHREESRRSADLGPIEATLGQKQADLAGVTGERDAIADSLDSTTLALYRRVAQRRSPAVVSLEGDACGGCHLPLSTEERRVVRTGTGITQCPSCDRILVP